jgi:transcriptional regulator with XRE-family HTH domain
MKDRILKFLESEKISPAEFADKIGVQRSSMSHILNGRNQPSAAFIQKMLQVYPLLNSRWLMIGEGTMTLDSLETNHIQDKRILPQKSESINESASHVGLHRENEKIAESGSLFFPEPKTVIQETDDQYSGGSTPDKKDNMPIKQDDQAIAGSLEDTAIEEKRISSSSSLPVNNLDNKEIEQILFFYKDKTFTIYRPS